MIGLEQMVGNKYFIIAYHVLRALKTSITKHEKSQCNASRLYERLIVTPKARHVEVGEEYVVTTAPLGTITAFAEDWRRSCKGCFVNMLLPVRTEVGRHALVKQAKKVSIGIR